MPAPAIAKKRKSGVSPQTITLGVCVAVAAICILFFFTEDTRPVRPRGPQQPGARGEQASDADLAHYEELCKQAEAAVEAGDYAKGEALYDEAVAANAVHPLAHFNLARIYDETGNHAKALAKYEHVLKLVPGRPEAEKTVHTNIALVLMNTNDIAGSVQHWELAIKASSRDAMLRFSLANALSLLGRDDEALAQYKKATELDKKEAKYLVEYGRQLLKTGAVEEGQANFNKGLEIGDEQQLFQLGMYLRQKDRDAAERIFEAIIDKFPDHPGMGSVMYFLGLLYRAAGKTSDEKALYAHGVEQGVFPSVHQRPMFRFPTVPASSGYPEPADVAGAVALLEESSVQIAAELQALIENPDSLPTDAEGLAHPDGAWHQLTFIRNGVFNASAAAAYPVTARVLESVREQFGKDLPRGSADLSLLKSGGYIEPHCGPVNFRTRLHLGLAIPADSGMRVAGETRTWAVGKVTVLDDSFEHEVWNNGTGTRAVLIVDVWNPALSEQDRQTIRSQFSWSPRAAARSAVGH